jgi:hypothetical protein
METGENARTSWLRPSVVNFKERLLRPTSRLGLELKRLQVAIVRGFRGKSWAGIKFGEMEDY